MASVTGVVYGLTVLAAAAGVAAMAQPTESLPLEAFATLGSLRQIELSPEGRHVAYLAPAPEGKQVVVVHPVDDATRPTVLPLLPEGYVMWFEWLNEERLAVAYQFTQSVFGYRGFQIRGGRDLEQTRLFAFRIDGSDGTEPVHLARGDRNCGAVGSRLKDECPEPLVQHRIVDLLKDDPKHILLQVDNNIDGEWELRLVNVNNGRFRYVESPSQFIDTWITDLQHEVRLGLGTNDQNEWVALVKPPAGEWQQVRSATWLESRITPWAFERDPRYVIAVGPVNYDTDAIVRLDLAEGEVVEVLYEDEDYDLRPVLNEGELIGYRIPAAGNEMVLTSPQWKALYQTAGRALAGKRVRLLSWTPDLQTILVRASSDVDAGTVYVWDRKRKQMFMLGAVYPDLYPEDMSPMEEIHYEARDGLEIAAYLTVPRGAPREKLPVVLMPHGGPYARDTLGFDFLVQALASRGYAVLQPNFRGSTYQGREFYEAGEGEWGRKMQDDLEDGVAWLVAQGLADPERVCIVGWSYGGYAALMGVVATPELFQCAASINGVADLQRLRARWSFDPAYRRAMQEMLGTKGIRITDFSPVHQADRIRAPVLIVHAEDDGRVPFEHGRSMSAALERRDADITFVQIERGGHSLMNADSRLTMLTALTNFLEDHLTASSVP
jgi:dipeptidyl aminopeptidase/acylaminoacyl peptidase